MKFISYLIRPIKVLATITNTDKATFWALFLRVWIAISSPISLFLISQRFSIEVQGYYYTFASILAIQLFAELGLGQVLTQFASHEWAELSVDNRMSIRGSEKNHSRLASLVRFSFLWYGIAACGLMVVLAIIGLLFFRNAASIGTGYVSWIGPWLCLTLVTCLNFVFIPVWAILSGCGQIETVNTFRAIAGVMMNMTGWSAILLGSGLYTTVLTGAVSFILSGTFVIARYRKFFSSLISHRGEWKIDWRAEFLPMQGRIAISTAASYFMYNLFNPVIFRYHGPQAAACMGMSLAIGNALASMSGSWVETRAPVFGWLVAKNDIRALDRLFKKVTITSLIIASSGGAAIMFLFFVLIGNHPFRQRILPIHLFALIMVVVAANQLIGAFNVYMRAYRKEPTMAISVIVCMLTGASTLYLGQRYSVAGVTIGYAIIVLLFHLPSVAHIWYVKRREWQTLAVARVLNS